MIEHQIAQMYSTGCGELAAVVGHLGLSVYCDCAVSLVLSHGLTNGRLVGGDSKKLGRSRGVEFLRRRVIRNENLERRLTCKETEVENIDSCWNCKKANKCRLCLCLKIELRVCFSKASCMDAPDLIVHAHGGGSLDVRNRA